MTPTSEGAALREKLLERMAARRGHFRLESGHHGDLWLEIESLYRHPYRLRRFTRKLAERLGPHGVETVCGPLVGGALLAQMVAEELGAEFCFAEQFRRSPEDGLFPIGYHIPTALRDGLKGRRVAVVDDVINAGSAARGAFAEVQACAARPVIIGALLVLGNPIVDFAAREGVALESLGYLPNDLWEPASCPLCASGAPLEGVAAPLSKDRAEESP